MNFYQYLIIVILTALCASCSNHKDTQTNSYSSHIGIQYGESPKPINISSIEQKIYRLTNEFRQKKGLKPFKQSRYIDEAAREHSRYMKNQSDNSTSRFVISHDNAKQRAPKIMEDIGGISFAENVGALHRVREAYVAEKMVDGWITSKGHYKNLVGDYSDIGIGVSVGKDYTVFATQIFVKVKPVKP